VRVDNAAQNLAILRRIALNLLEQGPKTRTRLINLRLNASSISDSYHAQILLIRAFVQLTRKTRNRQFRQVPFCSLSRKYKVESVKEISARRPDGPGIQRLLTDRDWLSGFGERVTVTIL
jgi:hypothetical protein